MNIWLFQSLVIAGPVKECRKWLDCHKKDGYAYSRCWDNRSTRGYACIRSNNTVESVSPLQRISAEKVVNLFQNGTLTVDALRSLPEELLTAVVQSVPLIVPSTEEDYVLTTRFGKEEKVGAPFKFNFAARDKLIEHIQRLRPDFSADWTSKVDSEQCVLNFQYWTGSLIPKPEDVIQICTAEQIRVAALVRQSCDWDRAEQNNFSRFWAIQNNEIVYGRYDLPQVVHETDHALVREYGHLLLHEDKIREDARTEFTSDTLGHFKLVSRWK